LASCLWHFVNFKNPLTKETDETANRNPLGLFDRLGHWRWTGCTLGGMVVSMKINLDEQAFPLAFDLDPDASDIERGMTLRDYFAAKAMLGYMNDCYDLEPTERATAAYKQADEMLKAR
jgi:hypothetical protein